MLASHQWGFVSITWAQFHSNFSRYVSLILVAKSFPGLLLGLHPANERRRYKVTPSLIGWARALNQPWFWSYQLPVWEWWHSRGTAPPRCGGVCRHDDSRCWRQLHSVAELRYRSDGPCKQPSRGQSCHNNPSCSNSRDLTMRKLTAQSKMQQLSASAMELPQSCAEQSKYILTYIKILPVSHNLLESIIKIFLQFKWIILVCLRLASINSFCRSSQNLYNH